VERFTDRQLYPRRKLMVPTGEATGWPLTGLDPVKKRKNFCPYGESNPGCIP
jgi:hypothetical protein